jgi:hypothetical protein
MRDNEKILSERFGAVPLASDMTSLETALFTGKLSDIRRFHPYLYRFIMDSMTEAQKEVVLNSDMGIGEAQKIIE